MTGIMLESICFVKRRFNKKGQGIVEFALLCAFCAAIGLFVRDAGFSEAFYDSLDKSKPELYAAEIGQRLRNNYMEYYHKWRYKTAETIRSEDPENKERILADQKALVKIAETFLGKTDKQALNLMDLFSNSDKANMVPEYIAAIKCPSSGTGFSEGVLVPLSYKANSLDNNGDNDDNRVDGWIHFERNNNQYTTQYLTNQEAKTFDKYDKETNPAWIKTKNLKTVTTDRIFYSEDMLNYSGGKVTVRLHYTNGKVDFVDIALRVGNPNPNDGNAWVSNKAAFATDLCLHVVESGHTLIENTGTAGDNDIINKPTNFYKNDSEHTYVVN